MATDIITRYWYIAYNIIITRYRSDTPVVKRGGSSEDEDALLLPFSALVRDISMRRSMRLEGAARAVVCGRVLLWHAAEKRGGEGVPCAATRLFPLQTFWSHCAPLPDVL